MIKAGNKTYTTKDDIPDVIPVFPLSGALLLPNGQLPLNIFEPRYLQMIEDVVGDHKIIGMVQPSLKPESAGIDPPPLCNIGCLGRVTAMQETGDGRCLISLTGICRYEIKSEISSNKPYRVCEIEVQDYDLEAASEESSKIPRERLVDAFEKFLTANQMDADWTTIENTDNDSLLTALCMMCPYGPAEKQAILEAPDLVARTETLIAISEFHIAQEGGADQNTIQ